MAAFDATYSPDSPKRQPFTTTRPGQGALVFERAGPKTVLGRVYAASPLRFLTPRNHGPGAWAYLSNLGGGLVDGDHVDLDVRAERDSTAFLGTQASTKVYRSPRGCSQRLDARAGEGAALAIVPDPVVCFAGARYRQEIAVSLAPTASLVLVDGYTSGRAARGERWAFAAFESRTTITRAGVVLVVDAIRLDPGPGPIVERMGRFDAIQSIVVVGPRFAAVREAMLAPLGPPSQGDATIVAASPIGADAAVLRVASDGFENASRAMRRSFDAIARALGDDPFARKW
jgi:urease accessory protein